MSLTDNEFLKETLILCYPESFSEDTDFYIPSLGEVLNDTRLQALEYERCQRWLPYFLFRYVYTFDEKAKERGETSNILRFPSKNHLKWLCFLWIKYNRLLISKSRRTLLSWFVVSAIFWEMLTKDYQKSFIWSKKTIMANKLLERIQFEFDLMEKKFPFIINGITYKLTYPDKAGFMKFSNNSEIFAMSGENIRGEASNISVIDEASSIPTFEDINTAIKPALELGGKYIALSSAMESSAFDMLVEETRETGKLINLDRGVAVTHGEAHSVVDIWYYADPDHDPLTEKGKKWYDQMRKLMTEKDWKQEYEKDALAKCNTLVYSTFSTTDHVRDFTWRDIPKDWTVYFATDPGIDSECAGLWLAVDKDNCLYVFDEYYQREKTILQNARDMLAIDKSHNSRYRYGFYDRSSVRRSAVSGQPEHYEYQRGGLKKLCASGNITWGHGVELVRDTLKSWTNDEARLLISSDCVNLIKEFKHYRFNSSGKTTGKDHLLDCLRYIVSVNPHWVNPKKRDKYKVIRKNGFEYLKIERDNDEY